MGGGGSLTPLYATAFTSGCEIDSYQRRLLSPHVLTFRFSYFSRTQDKTTIQYIFAHSTVTHKARVYVCVCVSRL